MRTKILTISILAVTALLSPACVSASLVQADSLTFKFLNKVEIPDDGSTLDPCVIVPSQGLFSRDVDGRMKSLDREKCMDFEELIPTENLWYDQIQIVNSGMMVRSGSEIYHLADGATTLLCSMSIPSFRIFPGADNEFNVVAYEDSVSTLYRGDLTGVKPLQAIASLPLPIMRTVTLPDGDILFASGGSIYICSGEDPEQLLAGDADITDFTVTPSGMLIMAADSLWLMGDDVCDVVATGPMQSIHHDQGRTYLVMDDGDIFYSDKF